MADHTIVNLKQVEDAAGQRGVPGLQARFARSALELENSGITLFDLEPEFKVPWGHRHESQEEIYLVLRGSAAVVFEDGTAELGEWDAVRIPPSVARSFQAGPDGAQILAFVAGPQGDAEMIQDFW